MATFWEKYKDPRWQRRRLEIMSASHFECQNCGDKESTLNVHHKLYRKGANPWDYSDEELECLCESCHEAKHAAKTMLNQIVAASYFDLNELAALISGFLDANSAIDPAASEMGWQSSKTYYEIGLAAAAIELEVFTLGSTKPARDIVRAAQKGRNAPPAVRNSIEDWNKEDGAD